LDATEVTSGMLTPDGQKLIAIGGSYPGKLFIIDIATEAVPAYGKIPINAFSVGTPIDFVVTQDSRYAVVVSAGARMSAFDLRTGVNVLQQSLAGIPNAVSISPTGAIFITGASTLYEYRPEPPFDRIGYSKLQVSPGDLHFSPDGRYALASAQAGTSHSIILFDSAIPGSNDTAEAPSMGVLNQVPIVINDNVAKPTNIYFKSNNLALAYFAAEGRFFDVTFPGMSNGIRETSFPWVSQLTGVPLVAFSDEFPIGKNMYYANQAGQATRLDLTGVSQPSSALAYVGPTYFGKAASTGIPVTVVPYGTGQTVAPGAVLKPYSVRVLDSNGRPVYNTPVRFQTGAQAILVSVTETRTNLDGLALVTVTAPSVNGDFTVTAEVGTVSVGLTSKVAGAAGGGGGEVEGAPKVVKVSGDGQLRGVLQDKPNPLVIRVVDADGKPLAGREVVWSAQSGVVLQGNTTALTDVNGEATIVYIGVQGPAFGGAAYITYYITASVPGIGTATFVGTGYDPYFLGLQARPAAQLDSPRWDNPNITMKLGTKAVDAVQVHVFSTLGFSINAPIPNVGLEVHSVNQDPAVGPVAQCEGGLIFTKQDGRASCTLIVKGKIGSTSLVIDIGDGYNVLGASGVGQYVLTVNPGDPAVPVIIQGNNQSGKPGALLPTMLTIEVSDGFGNTMSGVPVAWTPQTAGSITLSNTALLTGADGRASTRVQLGPNSGVFDLKVTVDNKDVIFKVTVETQVAGFNKVSGDNQTGVMTGQPFPSPVVVRVTDGLGNPVTGVTVNFAVTSGQASLSAINVEAGANGQASVAVTAGLVAGNITIAASIPNFQALVFNLASRLPGPAVTATSFRNYSTNEAGIAPGLLVKISGQGLTTGITGEYWANMLRARLPESMMGFKVEFVWSGGRAFAPVMAISNSGTSEWALVQVPFELTGSTASAIVSVGEGNTTVQNIPVSPLMPGILEENFDGGRRAAIAVRSDGEIVSPTKPARKGEIVRMYVIGMGQTTPMASTNRVGVPDQVIALPVQVGLEGGKSARVVEAKMAENLVGIYEILFEIPQDAPTGTDLAIACSVVVGPTSAVWSNESRISIQ
jgi:uncharacterized protein (TIGR03437 family)